MTGIRTAEIDHFAVTINGSLLIFATVMSEMTFHQPRLSMMRVDLENTVNEYLRNFPPFFGNCPRSVRPVDTNL
jgi:hypothetical protein